MSLDTNIAQQPALFFSYTGFLYDICNYQVLYTYREVNVKLKRFCLERVSRYSELQHFQNLQLFVAMVVTQYCAINSVFIIIMYAIS